MQNLFITAVAVLILPLFATASGVPEGFEKPEHYPDPERLVAEIEAYEWIDYIMAPAENAVVATGSSSITGWDNRIHKDLSPLTIIPRGFGSSTMYDLLYFSDKIVIPYKPSAILIYEGDNDVAWNVAPEDIRKTFAALVDKIHRELPESRIYMLAIKPSISRASMWPDMETANQLLKEACEADDLLHYIDIATPMRQDGEVVGKYINSDDLHMNDTGYDLWAEIVQREMVLQESGSKTD